MLSANAPRADGNSARLARVVKQLRSVAALHGRELEQLAEQLQAAGHRELAERLRVFRGLHADEIGVAIDELEDMLGEPTQPESRAAEESPKRARWLEEQEEEKPQPLTRRELLNLGNESEPD
jgi:hypothetical protein